MIKNPGKSFEVDFKESCIKEGLFIHRLRDNAMSYTESESVYTWNNPYDFLVYKLPTLFAVELKHTKYMSMSIQRTEAEEDNKMIKYCQIEGLQKASKYEGVKAGFILSFYNEITGNENTFYISIDNFINFLVKENKKSINMLDVIRYDGIKVTQTKKRVKYHYHISELINKI